MRKLTTIIGTRNGKNVALFFQDGIEITVGEFAEKANKKEIADARARVMEAEELNLNIGKLKYEPKEYEEA